MPGDVAQVVDMVGDLRERDARPGVLGEPHPAGGAVISAVVLGARATWSRYACDTNAARKTAITTPPLAGIRREDLVRDVARVIAHGERARMGEDRPAPR